MKKQLEIQPLNDRLYHLQITRVMTEDDFETPVGESETQQEQSLTITQILQRFAQGVAPQSIEGQFSEDPEDFDQDDLMRTVNADLYDREARKAEISAALEVAELQLKQQNDEKEKNDAQAQDVQK